MNWEAISAIGQILGILITFMVGCIAMLPYMRKFNIYFSFMYNVDKKPTFLPDEATQGAPFWTLMEIQSGEITGTYFSLPEGKPIVPFFYSKVIAEKMREKLLDAENWVVRGVSQYQLKGFVAQMEVLGVEAAVFYVPYWKEGETDVPMVIIPKEKLKEEYIY